MVYCVCQKHVLSCAGGCSILHNMHTQHATHTCVHLLVQQGRNNTGDTPGLVLSLLSLSSPITVAVIIEQTCLEPCRLCQVQSLAHPPLQPLLPLLPVPLKQRAAAATVEGTTRRTHFRTVERRRGRRLYLRRENQLQVRTRNTRCTPLEKRKRRKKDACTPLEIER